MLSNGENLRPLQRSWQVIQATSLLSWIERPPLPFGFDVAACEASFFSTKMSTTVPFIRFRMCVCMHEPRQTASQKSLTAPIQKSHLRDFRMTIRCREYFVEMGCSQQSSNSSPWMKGDFAIVLQIALGFAGCFGRSRAATKSRAAGNK